MKLTPGGHCLYDKRYCPIPVDKPMKIATPPEDYIELMESGDYMLQVKKDGFFVQIVAISPAEIHMFIRNIDRKTGFFRDVVEYFPNIRHWAQYLPPYSIVAGEIYFEGQNGAGATKILNFTPKEARKRQNDRERGKRAQLWLFDILMLGWRDLRNFPYVERFKALAELAQNTYDERGSIHLAETYTGRHLYRKFQEILDRGEEGVVVKKRTSRYKPGLGSKREVFKVKRFYDDIDCFISDVMFFNWDDCCSAGEWGKKESYFKYYYDEDDWTFYDEMKVPLALELSVMEDGKPKKVGRLSIKNGGIPYNLSRKIYDNPEDYIWQALTVRADRAGVSPIDRDWWYITHCRFGRFRYDIFAEDCSWDKLAEQLKLDEVDPKVLEPV